MRYNPRVDRNQSEIIQALRSVHGISVFSLAGVGKGCPDLLVGANGKTYLVEVKDGQKAKLTSHQEQFIKEWNGDSVVILRDAEIAKVWAARIA
jgi:Holliday junction resolvase